MGVMFSCTSSKHVVPPGEFLIHGKLANVPDGTVVELYKGEGNISSRVQKDTLVDGEFFFRDTVSSPRMMQIMSMEKGFPGMSLDVWVAPGKYIKIAGQDKLIGSWQVKSDIPEQQEQDRYRACGQEVQRELQILSAAEYDLIKDEGEWSKIDSFQKLEYALHKIVFKAELKYMESAPVSNIWMGRLLFYASLVKYEDIMPYPENVKALYVRMSEAEKQTVLGKEITAYIYPASTVGVGDEMVDGDLYDREGKVRHISEFRGKYILLDFWSGGCAPCVESIPEMKEVVSVYEDKVVVVSISEDPKSIWNEVMDEYEMTGNQWNELRRGRTGLAARYRVNGIPAYVLIAPDGKIQDTWCGYGKGALFQKMRENLTEVRD